MPETTMDEYYCTVFGKNHIRLARQALDMKAVSKSHAVQIQSQEKFRPGILALDTNCHPEYILFRSRMVHDLCLSVGLAGI